MVFSSIIFIFAISACNAAALLRGAGSFEESGAAFIQPYFLRMGRACLCGTDDIQYYF